MLDTDEPPVPQDGPDDSEEDEIFAWFSDEEFGDGSDADEW